MQLWHFLAVIFSRVLIYILFFKYLFRYILQLLDHLEIFFYNFNIVLY